MSDTITITTTELASAIASLVRPSQIVDMLATIDETISGQGGATFVTDMVDEERMFITALVLARTEAGI